MGQVLLIAQQTFLIPRSPYRCVVDSRRQKKVYVDENPGLLAFVDRAATPECATTGNAAIDGNVHVNRQYDHAAVLTHGNFASGSQGSDRRGECGMNPFQHRLTCFEAGCRRTV